jgi:hypothetical protein
MHPPDESRKEVQEMNAGLSDLPKKERIIVQRLRNFIDNNVAYIAALIAGISGVGKTTALKQLQAGYPNAKYIDCLDENITDDFLDDALDGRYKLLLLDGITHYRDFENTAQYIYNMAGKNGFKVIMTGASPAHITKLSMSKLGGGRARLFRLPPVTFTEYLYMTGRIPNYSEYDNVRNEDFADYLLLKGLESELSIHFNDEYLNTFYGEIQEGNKKRGLSNSLVRLKNTDLPNMCSLIARTLSTIHGGTKVNLSDIMLTEDKTSLSPQDKGRILTFLLWAGLANIELLTEAESNVLPDVSNIFSILKSCTRTEELQQLFDKVSVCLTTPLFYTRLGKDILTRENLCKGDLLGKLPEVYIRGALNIHSVDKIMSSVRLNYSDGPGEADICDEYNNLLIEVTCSDKPSDKVHLKNYMSELELIRVCSSDTLNTPNGCYYRIPYAKLCCMLDTGDIFKLTRSTGYDNLVGLKNTDDFPYRLLFN